MWEKTINGKEKIRNIHQTSLGCLKKMIVTGQDNQTAMFMPISLKNDISGKCHQLGKRRTSSK
jgi:hypothetical protein